ncbi:MAG: hypothetical protein IT375_12145 [Polyangiaceae bacterium]|nr:hypothetical protein [Polyangiaceae bacterium]
MSILDVELDAICATSRRAIEMHRSNTLSFTRRCAPSRVRARDDFGAVSVLEARARRQQRGQENAWYAGGMNALVSALSDGELLARLPEVRGRERRAIAEVIAHLAEVERRRLYLAEGCSSMYTFCIERLGYSENEAHTRLQVARLCSQFHAALEALESGAIHLTGLALLCSKVTEANAHELLEEARGKTRREIEALLARRFPRPDVLPSVTPLQPTLLEQSNPGPGASSEQAAQATGSTVPRSRVEPLSAASFRVEFTASAELRQKLELAQNLLSHAVPTGDLASLVERALDELLAAELKRRMGAGQPRARRSLREGSRHVPVEIDRPAGPVEFARPWEQSQAANRTAGVERRIKLGTRRIPVRLRRRTRSPLQ